MEEREIDRIKEQQWKRAARGAEYGTLHQKKQAPFTSINAVTNTGNYGSRAFVIEQIESAAGRQRLHKGAQLRETRSRSEKRTGKTE